LCDEENLVQSVLKATKSDKFGLTSLYTPTRQYRVVFSSYSDTSSTRVEPISPPRIFHESVDQGALAQLGQQRDQAARQANILKERMTSNDEKLNSIKREANQLQIQLNELKSYKSKLESAERAAQRAARDLSDLEKAVFKTDEEIEQHLRSGLSSNAQDQIATLTRYVVRYLVLPIYHSQLVGCYSTIGSIFQASGSEFFKCRPFE
jgi:phage-related minor tail protein